MNTADLIMDYQSITALAKEVAHTQEEFTILLRNMDSLVESMNGKWKGKAQTEFATAYSKLKPQLETVSQVLQNYTTALSKVVENEQILESDHKTMLSNMGIPSF